MADLQDGESTEMQGSGAKPYLLTNTGGVYSCTCPAWRNQSLPIEKRTCKHLRKLRGDEAEKDRIGSDLTPPRRASSSGSAAKGDGPPLLLAHPWDNATNIADWWMSEKLDGVRAYWDGSRFISRLGNTYHAPDWFVAQLPQIPLDGELWIGRKMFQRTVSVVRRQDRSDHWKEIRYLVFDAPQAGGKFEERLELLAETFGRHKHPYAEVLAHQRCRDLSHMRQELERVEQLGGEGLMLRQPASAYAVGRSFTLLKVKTFHDAEAMVVGHLAGKGRHKGRLGALQVRLANGTEFSVGTGFSDAERDSPPAVGSTITFRYQELTNAGVPRFPSFIRMEAGSQGAPRAAAPTAVTTPGAAPAAPAAKTPSGKPASSASPTAAATLRRYYELEDGKSSKFWEIVVRGSQATVRYGRIGADGTTKTKDFASDDAALAHAEKLIAEKQRKGYEQVDDGP